jgi:protein subunit release factor A
MRILVSPYVASKLVRKRSQFRLSTYKDSGPGGQHRNKTSSGVRIIDRVTGIMVECCDTRSQFENKEIAFFRLVEKLKSHYEEEERVLRARVSKEVQNIRTYKGNDVIDHRTGKVYPLDQILDGRLEMLISDLREWSVRKCLQE